MTIEIKRFLDLGGKSRSNAMMLNRVQSMTDNKRIVQLTNAYWKLLVDTFYLKEEAYDVLINLDSYATVEERYGTKSSYIRNIVYREKKRLTSDIGVDIYLDVLLYNMKSDSEIEYLTAVIMDLINQTELRDEVGYLDKVIIPLDDYPVHRNTELTNDSFVKMANVLKPLSKTYLKPILDSSDMGYIKYLLTEPDEYLSEQDLSRKSYLLQTWWLNE